MRISDSQETDWLTRLKLMQPVYVQYCNALEIYEIIVVLI